METPTPLLITAADIKTAVAAALTWADSTKNAYFWHPSNCASGRRSQERRNEGCCFKYSFDVIQHLKTKDKITHYDVEVNQTFSVSCHYVYRHSRIYINGVKSTSVGLKKFLDVPETDLINIKTL